MSLKGIDVSQWQSNIDWEKVKPQIDFTILRLGWISSTGNHTLDKKFERNYSECKRLGIPIGVYVYNYANSENTAKSGANWAIEKLNDKTLELPVYIDMEDNKIAGLSKEKLTNICIAFNTIIESKGLWAGVYANLNWFKNYLNADEIKKRYTTWIAHYGVSQDKYNGQYDMLQYSSSGTISGISGNVDMNIMYRDLVSEIAGTSANNLPVKKSIEEIAQEVINGLWGNGQDRINKLTAAGYNATEVQNKVNAILKAKKTIHVYYTVKKGDTLVAIAKKYNTTYKHLAQINNIKNPNVINVGQKLLIK